MSDALPLPPRPNLEQYKKLAKDFQSACRSAELGAVRDWAARWAENITRLQGIEISPQVRKDIDRNAQAIERRWHKIEKTQCRLADAQFFIAREHGFASWPKFAKHVEALARANSQISNFEAAAEAIVTGDLAGLNKLLHGDPDLARARSTREHHSTLLHYVSANGVEDYRQRTPKNIVEITKMLLDAGTDVNAESDAYGGGCTALGLVATSIHPEQAGVQIALLQTLLERGARIDQPSPAGNRHSIINACLANGQPKAAEFFLSLGAPVDLEAAAALGMLSLVESYFDENGHLRPHANRKQMESAFLNACGAGRREVVEFLLERGVDPGSHNDGHQTGLHCAAYGAHVHIVKLLLEHRAPIDVKDANFNATPLDVALWVWDHSPDRAVRERCYEVISLLARASAKLDPQQWDDPDSDQPGMLEKIRSDTRVLAALRGEITIG
jgi:hypothetical protein